MWVYFHIPPNINESISPRSNAWTDRGAVNLTGTFFDKLSRTVIEVVEKLFLFAGKFTRMM